MYYVATRRQRHHGKYTRHLHKLHLSIVVIQREKQQQRKMVDNFQKLHAITARRQDIMWEIANHK